MSAHKVWRGHLTFGLLSIPVYLNVAARDKRVELHTFHTECNGPVKSPKYCPACAKMLSQDEVYKGYQAGNGIVRLSDQEIEAVTPASDKVLEISECVKWSDIDPIYLAESFFLLPDTAGQKAYAL